MKTKIADLDVGNSKTVPMESNKIDGVVSKEFFKNTKFNKRNTKMNNLEKKIRDTTTLIHKNQYNTDKQSLEKQIRHII